MKKIFFSATFIIVAFNLVNAQYNFQFLGKKTYPGQNLSGSWGYSDTIKHKEYALVGAKNGTSIVDISNPTTPVEVALVSGSPGGGVTWREMQTYSHYAYVVHDVNNSLDEGLQIVDLQYLPDSVQVTSFKGTTVNDVIHSIHSLFIDKKGFLYLNGGQQGVTINGTGNNGVAIYDLKANPKSPIFIGYTPSLSGTGTNYVHDCYVRGDTMYQAHIYSSGNNRFTVWDIRDRANPIKIQDFITPYEAPHNIWLSDNGKTLFISHEKSGLPAEAYDISDIFNIHQLCEFRISPTNQEILHNVHVLNDYIIASYYSDGVAIFDASVPDNIVTIGYYDTQPSSTNTENGVWGAYGFYKSGLITLSDMNQGFFVVKPTYIRAARMQGIVTDTNTTQVLTNAKISFIDTANSASTDIDGFYKTGTVKSGLTNFKAEKTGYITKYFTAMMVNGKIDTVNIQLRQIPVTSTQRNSICQGRDYTLPDGRIATAAGTYVSDIVLPSGKDSIITTILTQKNKSTASMTTTLCPGANYILPSGKVVTAGATYSDTIPNAIGCDSIITVNLPVHPVYAVTKQDSIASGAIYHLPNGSTTSTQGVYVDTLHTSFGCDSVVTIDLKVLDVTGIRNNTSDIQLKFTVNNNELSIINHSNSIITELGIYNSIGILVVDYHHPENTILLPSLPKDIYILRAITNTGEQRIGKVVIY